MLRREYLSTGGIGIVEIRIVAPFLRLSDRDKSSVARSPRVYSDKESIGILGARNCGSAGNAKASLLPSAAKSQRGGNDERLSSSNVFPYEKCGAKGEEDTFGFTSSVIPYTRKACESPRSFGHTHHTMYQVACVYSILGLNEQALAWLDEPLVLGFAVGQCFAQIRVSQICGRNQNSKTTSLPLKRSRGIFRFCISDRRAT